MKILKVKKSFLNLGKVAVLGCFMLFASSCDKDDDGISGVDCNSNRWAEQFEEDLNKFVAVAQRFTEEQTEANCIAYRNAGEDYVNAIESILPCVPTADRAEFETDLAELRAEFNSLDCSDF